MQTGSCLYKPECLREARVPNNLTEQVVNRLLKRREGKGFPKHTSPRERKNQTAGKIPESQASHKRTQPTG